MMKNNRSTFGKLFSPALFALAMGLGLWLLISISIPATQPVASAESSLLPRRPNQVNGTVFRDYNENGVQDAGEPGVSGVAVNAIDGNGASYNATTDGSGVYALSIPDGRQVRVQFTVPTGFQPSVHNTSTNDGTTVAFVTSPVANVNLGINKPGDYCQSNPKLSTSCFVYGYQITSTMPVVVTFSYNNSGTAPVPDHIANGQDVGTTWGMAYRRSVDTVYVSAFMKRHTGFGPSGPGAIYSITNANQTSGQTISALVTLNAGSDPHPNTAGGDWAHDANAWDAAGKLGLGDLDISEDESTLYAVNLFDRKLYKIPIATPGSNSSYTIPSPCVANSEPRPFGLGMDNGLIYVGGVCSAQTNQSTATLQAYIYSFNPTTNTFSGAPVLQFPLNYTRGCADNASLPGCPSANWRPWASTFQCNATGAPDVNGIIFCSWPQPMLTDIVFDNGSMVIGIRDRYGDQMGNGAKNTTIGDNQLYSGITAGEIMRACPNGGGGWNIESNGSCGGTTTAGANKGEGLPVGGCPNCGEFYYQDDYRLANNTVLHDQVSMGGLVQVPGLPNVVETVFDPIQGPAGGQVFTGGVRWFNNNTGTQTKAYQIYGVAPNNFSKSNGLGDLEALCNAAPLEIGNRVWRDTNNNGIQDAGEPGIAGVTVRLFNCAGQQIATTTTDANGNYYFTGMTPGTCYVVRLDNGGNLTGLSPTSADQGSNTSINSKGVVVNGFVQTSFTTSGPGYNNHTFDFGFVTSGSSAPSPTPATTGNVPASSPKEVPEADTLLLLGGGLSGLATWLGWQRMKRRQVN